MIVPHVPELAACLTRGTGLRYDTDTDTDTILPVAFAENTRAEVRLEGGDGSRTGALSAGGGKAGQGVPMIAFPANLSGTQHASTENLAPAMGAKNPTAVALAVALRGREGGATAELGDEVQNCLRASSGGGDKPHVLAYTTKLHNTASNNAGKIFEERSTCLDANSPPPALLTAMQVRRLTPMECERLQGFPDGYTDVRHRNKPAADGPRYKALGNSWAVPNVRWLGTRIDAVALIRQTNLNLEAA